MTIDELWETITTLDKVIVDLQEGRRNLAKQPLTIEVKNAYNKLIGEINDQRKKRYRLACEVNNLLGDKYHLLPNDNILITIEGEVAEVEKL